MKTQIFGAASQKENGSRIAGAAIRAGGLVAFPTETVYGLGANGLDEDSVAKIFEVKGRPQDNPLILHIAKKSDAKALYLRITPIMRTLMDTFWPGPLTIIAEKSSTVPDIVTAGLSTVALRMPSNKAALAFLREANVPVAAPSANISGRPSPTTAQHVRDDLFGMIDVIIDGGPCEYGLESTVISVAGTPTILRPGAVTREMLEAVIGPVKLAPSLLKPLADGETALSPGMKHKHYAPEAEVRVAMDGDPSKVAHRICVEYDKLERENKSSIIFATEQTKPFYRGREYVIIGDRSKPETLCASLFYELRKYSSSQDVILAEALPASDMGLAYMNRLLRAAGFNTLEV